MKHKTILSLLLMMLSLAVGAQGVDPILTQLVQENRETVALGKAHRLKRVAPRTVNGVDTLEIQRRVNVRFHPDGSLRQLCILGTLADGAACPQAELDALGIKVTCTVGRLVIMDVPAASFAALTQLKAFKWLAADKVHQLDNYEARRSTTTSVAALEQAYDFLGGGTVYDGKGVVLGVIDIGIDFNHVAFRDPSATDGQPYTRSRIKEAITFSSAKGNDPIVTTGDAILNLTTGSTTNSHGTHTSATAGGSYNEGGQLRGMAPGADLVLADCSNSLSDAHIITSASAIFDYAMNAQKPCVISVSLGSNNYFHDGSDAIAEAFSTLTAEESNYARIICVSAGNESNKKMSIQKTLGNGGVLKTVMGIYGRYQDTNYPNYPDGLSGFIYANDGKSFTIQFKAVDVTTGNVYSLEEKPLVLNSNGSAASLPTEVTKYPNKKFGVELKVGACHFTDENVRLGIFATAGADDQQIVVIDKSGSLMGQTKYPTTLADYTDGNADMSINVMACTDGVISVGAYTDRSGWLSLKDGNKYHTTTISQYPVGSVAPFSSYGTDDNGVERPDVVAPGSYICSAYNIYDTNTFESGTPKETKLMYMTNKVENLNDRVHYYGSMTGTSMACPVAAGIVALWLQANPKMTTAQVRSLLQQSAVKDKYTTVAENTPAKTLLQAGSGKIDAVQGLMRLLNYHGGTYTDDITMKRNIATYYNTSGYSLDLRNPGCNIKAYKAIYGDEQQQSGTVLFKRTSTLSASEAFLLTTSADCSSAAPYIATVPIIPDPYQVYPTTEVNHLYHGAAGDGNFYENSNMFVLSQQNGVTAFYPLATATTAEDVEAYRTKLAGKGILWLPETSASQVKAMAITLGEEETADGSSESIALSEEEVLEGHLAVGEDADGITSAKAVQTLDVTDIYDLQGRKVSVPGKGLYIMGGRKVLFTE